MKQKLSIICFENTSLRIKRGGQKLISIKIGTFKGPKTSATAGRAPEVMTKKKKLHHVPAIDHRSFMCLTHPRTTLVGYIFLLSSVGVARSKTRLILVLKIQKNSTIIFWSSPWDLLLERSRPTKAHSLVRDRKFTWENKKYEQNINIYNKIHKM